MIDIYRKCIFNIGISSSLSSPLQIDIEPYLPPMSAAKGQLAILQGYIDENGNELYFPRYNEHKNHWLSLHPAGMPDNAI